MKESLFNILELQEIDNQADSLEAARRDYPEEIDLIANELEEARQQIRKYQQKQEELEKSIREHERELEAATADLKKHQDRLYEVKTNKEYDALQIEIEACRARVSEQEDHFLSAEEALEKLKSDLKNDQEEFALIEKKRLEKRKALLKELNSIGAKVKKQQKKMEAVRVGINARVLQAYDRLRKGRSGIAVVRVVKSACGGCFLEIPPQRASEVRKRDRIILCESCGRILVWDNQE